MPHAQAESAIKGTLRPPEHNSALPHAKYEFRAALLTFFSSLLGTFQKMGIVRRHSLSLTPASQVKSFSLYIFVMCCFNHSISSLSFTGNFKVTVHYTAPLCVAQRRDHCVGHCVLLCESSGPGSGDTRSCANGLGSKLGLSHRHRPRLRLRHGQSTLDSDSHCLSNDNKLF